MDKKDRILTAFQFLKRRGVVHTRKDVSLQMGASASNVSSAFNGVESVLTDRFLLRFNHAFGDVFNINWLLTGVGEMLAPTAGESDIDEMFDADIQANNNVIAQNHHTGDLTINAADSAAVVQKENEMLKEKVGLLERMLKEKDVQFERMLKEKDEIIGLMKEMMRRNKDNL